MHYSVEEIQLLPREDFYFSMKFYPQGWWKLLYSAFLLVLMAAGMMCAAIGIWKCIGEGVGRVPRPFEVLTWFVAAVSIFLISLELFKLGEAGLHLGEYGKSRVARFVLVPSSLYLSWKIISTWENKWSASFLISLILFASLNLSLLFL